MMILLENIYREYIIAGGCTLVLIAAFFGGCSLLNQKMGLPDDNPIEEIIEDLIEQETNLPIDLTPESKESFPL